MWNLATPQHDRHHRADVDASFDREQTADTKRHRDGEVMHEVHAEVHGELDAIDAHVETEDTLDAFFLRHACLDDIAADAADGADALFGAPVDRLLQGRHEQRRCQQESDPG